MDAFWHDVRHGIRVLRQARGFAFLAIVVLGLGIAASATIVSAIHGVLLRPLPYREPDRLVALWESNPELQTSRAGVSPPAFAAWKSAQQAFEGLAAHRPWGFDLSGSGQPERLLGARVSANLFSLLGVTPFDGRLFEAGDETAAQPNVALVSEELWRRRFGADPALVGSILRLDGLPHTVVGIVPRGHALPEAELWVPLIFAPYEQGQWGNRALSVVGRLKRGADLAAARGDMQQIARMLARQLPASHAGWNVALTTLREDVTGSARPPLLLLFAASTALLLAACANLSNLFLARSTFRRREMALRAALGAGRSRIVRQLFTECLLIVVAAGACGLFLASSGADLLARLDLLPRSGEIRIDLVTLGFALVSCLVIAGGLALVPVLDAVRADPGRVLKETSPERRRRTAIALRDLPVVAQLALALPLLIGAGLLGRSLSRARAVDLGFSADHVLSMTVSLPGPRYPSDVRRADFFEQVGRRIAALPGVHDTGLVSHLPLAGGALQGDFTIDGPTATNAESLPLARLVNVGAGYFAALRVPLRRGRAFVDTDRAGSPAVVIVDETLARRFWPDGDPLGKRLRLGATLGADPVWREIVGVVASVRAAGPEREAEPTIYIPHAQNPWPTMGLVVRTTGPPLRMASTVIAQVRALDPDQPVYNVRSLDQVVARVLASRRVETVLLGGAALAVLLLAVVGVYGMLTYAVAQRTRDLGIRAALGARRRQIVGHCLGRGLPAIVAGLGIGAATALVAARSLRALLFSVGPWDPATFTGALLLLGCTSLVACYVPARRAARLDPLVSLRHD